MIAQSNTPKHNPSCDRSFCDAHQARCICSMVSVPVPARCWPPLHAK
jgi:hypothetical protein